MINFMRRSLIATPSQPREPSVPWATGPPQADGPQLVQQLQGQGRPGAGAGARPAFLRANSARTPSSLDGSGNVVESGANTRLDHTSIEVHLKP